MPTERPRVLFLGPDVPGGMATSIGLLLSSPLAEQYEIELVPTHSGTAVGTRIGVFGKALARLAWWSLRGRGRIVHVHATVRGSSYRKSVCVLVAKALRRRVILHMHSGPGDVSAFGERLRGLSGAILRFCFRRADRVLTVSARSAAAISAVFGLGGTDVVPNPAPPAPAGAGSAVGAPNPLAVFMGGFANRVKGGAEILEALSDPALQGLRIVLAGPGDLPVAGEELIAARPEIRWLGWLDPEAKAELLSEASIFVLPSTSEGLPMALLEAMSYRLAIVATAVGGVPDLLEEGADGIVVEPGDPHALVTAITALAADPDRRLRLGEAAGEKAAAIGPEPVAARLEGIYRELLGGRA